MKCLTARTVLQLDSSSIHVLHSRMDYRTPMPAVSHQEMPAALIRLPLHLIEVLHAWRVHSKVFR